MTKTMDGTAQGTTLSHQTASRKHLQSLRVAGQARLEPWHSMEKSGELSDAAWRSGGLDGTTRQGQGKTLDFQAFWRVCSRKRADWTCWHFSRWLRCLGWSGPGLRRFLCKQTRKL